MKKFILTIIALAIVTGAGLTACRTKSDEVVTIISKGSYVNYESVEDLIHGATDIIRVQVLDERVELINVLLPLEEYMREYIIRSTEEQYEIHTVNRLRILEVFEGSKQIGDIIEVAQLGGFWENTDLIDPDRLEFIVGDELVLFLVDHGVDNLPTVLVNQSQAAYRSSVTQETIGRRNANEKLVSVCPRNALSLTIDDLQQITERKLD